MAQEVSAHQERHLSEQMESLLLAFQQFSTETDRLEKAYKSLQKRFLEVNAKLEKSDRTLQKKVIELDLISHYLQSLLSHINEGILFVGRTGMISTFNAAAEKILGVKRKKVLFGQFWDFFSDDLFGFSLNDALKTGRAPGFIPLTFWEKELEIGVSFIRKGPKSTQGIILLLRDMTEVRSLQTLAHLNERMKELGEMAAFVAHEIRNPLGGILGFASLLKRGMAKEKKSLEKIDYIIEGTQRLNHLVEEVLHYARPLRLRIALLNINHLLLKLVELLKADVRSTKKIAISTELPSKPLMAVVDEELLTSALLNIMLNGVQAMPEGGTLMITLSQKEDLLHLNIKDTGTGIEKKDLVKIFSPFFSTKEKGCGLGLSKAYKIIRAHLGKLEVSSQVGVGTNFLISLPLRGMR